MNILQHHVDYLGREGRDKVTNFEGVVTSVGFDLFGCVQAVLSPRAKDGKHEDGRWFDINRIAFIGDHRVMPVPSFAHLASPSGVHEKGPAEKPTRGW